MSFAPKVKGQKANKDGWIAVSSKKDQEVQKRLERKAQLAKEAEELKQEQEKAELERNPYLSKVKVDKSLKYASFEEVVKRTEATDKKEEFAKMERQKQEREAIKAKQIKKAKQQKAAAPRPTVEDALSQAKITDWVTRFPKNPDVQLKCLAENFHTFGESSKTDVLTAIPAPVKNCIAGWINSFPAEHISEFTLFLLDTHISNETSKEHNYGIKSLLDLVVSQSPNALISVLPQFQKKTKSGVAFNVKEHITIVLDFISSVLPTNVRTGLYLPTLANPGSDIKVCESIVDTLEPVFEGKLKGATGKETPISVPGLVQLFLLKHSSKRAKKLIEKVNGIYDQVMDTVVFDQPTSPRRVFASFLPYATAVEGAPIDEDFRFAALSFLTKCLALDSQCFKLLKNAYLQNIAQTNNILRHIADNWQAKENKSGLPTQPKARSHFYQGLVDLIKYVTWMNGKLLAGEYKPEGATQPVSIKRLGLQKATIETSTATCYEVEKVTAATPPPRLREDGEVEEGIGKLRLVLIVLLLIFIYFVWAHEIQFGDIKHFINDNKAKLGL